MLYTPAVVEPDGRYPGPNWQTHQISANTYIVDDHFGGFDANYRNELLDSLPSNSVVYTEYVLSPQTREQYPALSLRFSGYNALVGKHVFDFVDHCEHTQCNAVPLTNFISCFCRSETTGRIWLLSRLNELGWLTPGYYSKHFALPERVLNKVDCTTIVNDKNFAEQIVQIAYNGNTFDHAAHIPHLVPVIAQCFINVVAETQSFTYEPFWTEKFLYPVAAKSVWIAMAGPNYHRFLEQQLGFRLFDIFDYSFDSIKDPEHRLSAMLDSVRPFATLSPSQWQDIKRSQQAVLDHNYHWLRSKHFVNRLAQLDQFDEIVPNGKVPKITVPARTLNYPAVIADPKWNLHFGYARRHKEYLYWCQQRYGIVSAQP